MQTTPLTKSIKTGEYWLGVGLNVALGVAAIPSIHAISPSVAGVCATVTSGLLIAQRTLLKVKALSANPQFDVDVLEDLMKDLEGTHAA